MTRGPIGHFGTSRLTVAACAIALLAAMPLATAQTSPAGTQDRIREAGRIRLGYRTDAKPFSFRDEAGNPTGYSIAICQQVADVVKTELRLPSLEIQWVPVTAPDRFNAVQRETIDLLCGADTVTLERRGHVSFSTPVFPGGIGVMLRSDAPFALRNVLSGKGQTFRPTWRANASQVLQAKTFAAVSGTTAESWLTTRIKELEIVTTASTVSSYETGIDALLARNADALFGERAILLETAKRHAAASDLVVLDRLFTYEPLALAMGIGDEGFRLMVDRTLTRLTTSGELLKLYTKWFGPPDESAITFFRWNTLSE